MTVEAIVLGGLVVLVAGFGFAMAYAGRSPRDGDRREYGDSSPPVFAGDSGSDQGSAEGGDGGGGGDAGGGDAGGGDAGGGDGSGN